MKKTHDYIHYYRGYLVQRGQATGAGRGQGEASEEAQGEGETLVGGDLLDARGREVDPVQSTKAKLCAMGTGS